MRLKTFQNFLLEKFGVSDASLMFSDTLFNRIKSRFYDFIYSTEDNLQTVEIIGYRTLNPLIYSKELWAEFPVIKFEIQIDFNKLSRREFDKKYLSSSNEQNLEIKTGGFASYFGNKNWSGYSRITDPIKQVSDDSVIINLGISIDIGPDFDYKDNTYKNQLEDDINSTVYHELHHCYEHYVRVKKPSKILRPEYRSINSTLSWAENIWKFPKAIWKNWTDFTYLLYFSEFHETRANIQEIYYFIKKYPNKELKEFKIYKIAEQMENFSAEKYYSELLAKISEHEPYKGIESDVADRVKEMWVKTYKKECDVQKTKPVISFETLKKMNCLDFLKYWQKRINSQGKIIKRKANKIKSNL